MSQEQVGINGEFDDGMPELEPMSFFSEMWAFLRIRKKFWLMPIIMALLMLALLMVIGTHAGVVSPFIYLM